MQLVEGLYLATTAALVSAGLAMVWLAVRAYAKTHRHSMVHLSIGFTLVVGAAIATTVSAFVTDFQSVKSLLLVNSGLTASGFTFVVYSLIVHE
ncbi:MAG: hypothetical protein V5A46_11530 [Haloferacaceae archaeon]